MQLVFCVLAAERMMCQLAYLVWFVFRLSAGAPQPDQRQSRGRPPLDSANLVKDAFSH